MSGTCSHETRQCRKKLIWRAKSNESQSAYAVNTVSCGKIQKEWISEKFQKMYAKEDLLSRLGHEAFR